MLKHPTINKLHELRLNGMADALTEQQGLSDVEAFTFEERLGLLVEREVSVRDCGAVAPGETQVLRRGARRHRLPIGTRPGSWTRQPASHRHLDS